METLTREDALQRSSNVEADEIDVLINVSNAKSDERTFYSRSTLRFKTQLDTTFIDLIADSVESVTVNGAPASATVSTSRVTLTNLPVGEDLEVVIESRCNYSTTGEGLHRYFDPEDGETYLYTQFEPTDARRAWACFDQPDMKPRWRFSVKADPSWTVLSNQPEASKAAEGDAVIWTFKQTPPLSSYITAVVAGPYAHVDGGVWTGGADSQVSVALGVYCRTALAKYLDADDIFKVTREGLDFYHEHYGFTYPWGKYDQIYVPEYNLGAMENPGCVTFNERMISRDKPTRAARQSRANVIFHEMCHMWFGDLVTPKWWDDLWLKESFADNQGSMGLTEKTEFSTEWATFASGRKEWAYKQDQLPTTHPIAADIPDVEAAKNNFDGITYAKGAAVLKQLVAYVGPEAFFAGARSYFQEHACGAGRMSDFLAALEDASKRDNLKEWAKAWLETAGPSTIRARRTQGGYVIEQESVDLATGKSIIRPHRINVGLYKLRDDALERVDLVEVMLSEPVTLADSDEYDLVLVNDDDLTYALVDLSGDELEVARKYVSTIEGATSRAVVWSALWAAVRTARLDPSAYVSAVMQHVPTEPDDAVAADLIDNALAALTKYMTTVQRRSLARVFANAAIDAIGKAESSDRRREWARAATEALNLAGQPNDDQMQFLQDIAAANSPLLPVGPTLAWHARIALAAVGAIGEAEIDAYREADPSGEAEVFALQAKAALPDRIGRQRAWTRVLEEDLANNKMSAILAGLKAGALGGETIGFAGDFFDLVLPYWKSHTIGMGKRFVAGAYPASIDAARSEDAEALRFMAAHWLSAYEDAPEALRRLMLEAQDELERQFRIQSKWLNK